MQLIECTLDHEMSEIKFGYALFVLSCLKIYATLAKSCQRQNKIYANSCPHTKWWKPDLEYDY